jgi:NAD(P)-dependent dehydrogenase (short-subunit alcohol dehydrogenase family)
MNDEVAGAVEAAITHANGTAPEAQALACDIADYSSCRSVVRDVMERHGALDILVNCAGIVQSQGLMDIGQADLDYVVDVNLKGAFNLCKCVLEIMVPQGSGSIVNLASVAAQRGGGLVGGAHYAASKGGVISLTRSIAREFGVAGVRANVVCPSMTDTAMLDGNVSPEQYQQVIDNVPLRRAGRAIDVAGACLFLASDLAAYVTGATVDVNGGSHIH